MNCVNAISQCATATSFPCAKKAQILQSRKVRIWQLCKDFINKATATYLEIKNLFFSGKIGKTLRSLTARDKNLTHKNSKTKWQMFILMTFNLLPTVNIARDLICYHF